MIALLFGATGATGKALLPMLLENEAFISVHVFVRRPLEVAHPKLVAHVVNFAEPRTWHDRVQGDVAFSCLGTTLKAAGSQSAQRVVDYDYQLSVAEVARRNGVAMFILVSSSGADAKSKFFYTRMKGELEEAIKMLKFNRLAIFRPPILERPCSDRLAERLSVKLLKLLNGIGLLKRHSPLSVHCLAHAMMTVAQQDWHATRILEAEEIRSL